jgi:rhomboid family GlyGly-CTERM serine protease
VARGVSLTGYRHGGRVFAAAVAATSLLAVACFFAGSGVPASNIAAALDWQPGLAFAEPWRWWTAGLVHYSGMHLAANVAGAALVAAFALVARPSEKAAFAWLAAVAMTHLGLLLEPRLLHYGGLSGVLHAGVALIAVQLVARPASSVQRWIGAAVLAGLALKVALEAPWSGPLQYRAGWDIAIAPLAHATGVVSGTLAGLASIAAARHRRTAC